MDCSTTHTATDTANSEKTSSPVHTCADYGNGFFPSITCNPIQFDFLGAADGTRLTKRFVCTNTRVEVEPYPHVRDVTSHSARASTPDELFQLLLEHAQQGHCLLKGTLSRPAVRESRAGLTQAEAPTRWLLLDLDFDSGWDSVDDFLADLNPAWADVSYIWQHSSSAGIRCEPGLRGHLWLMLDGPVVPASVKLWLKERNLNVPGLQQHLRLTASGMSLKWGLDVSTCQNDKLIYIAPPILEGLDDPIRERIVLVRKDRDFAPVPPCNILPASVDTQTDRIVAELRAAAGMPRRKPKYQEDRDLRLLANPEQATVKGIKSARGFVYLNLNGGDSWGYYFPEDNPDILYNFKDEPLVRLQALAPDFYANYKRQLKRSKFPDVQPYVFRNMLTDTYFNLLYSKSEDRILLLGKVSTKDRMQDFLAQYGEVLPDPIPDWTVEFNPTTTKVIDPTARWINLFDPTDYLRHGGDVEACPQIPPIIDKVLTSVVGGCDLTKEHFLNWLACLVQTRKHLGTAWILHGVPGTGKGLLVSKVLTPILGPKHVTEWTTKEFDDPFNAPLERTCLLWLDEFKASSARNSDSLMSRLKHLITEPTLPVRAMRSETIERPHFVNVIIATNFPDPIPLDDSDRRFNVAPAQERALQITQQEVASIENELWLFASYLMHAPADLGRARQILKNAARESMTECSQSDDHQFFNALHMGDLDYFLGFLSGDVPSSELTRFHGHREAITRWCESYLENPGHPVKCTNNQLRAVFTFTTGQELSLAKFGRLASRHRLPFKTLHFGGNVKQRGLAVPFHTTDLDAVNEVLTLARTHGLRLIPGGKPS